jgi:SAM-dependent methyltransferase
MLENIPWARSTWRLGAALKTTWLDSPVYSRNELLRDYNRPVAWDYSHDEIEILRHRTELAMLERVIGPVRVKRALEIGCSEGVFTQLLADRCDSLVATDFLQIALDRARQRIRSGRVRFELLDLRVDGLPTDLDLICLIHVLDYVRNPMILRKIREKIVAALNPGGYLLLGTFDPTDEAHWWSRFLIRGGSRIIEFFAAHPKLTMLDSNALPHPPYDFADALLQKAC